MRNSVDELHAAILLIEDFYFSDVFPAYMIQRSQEDRDEAWQIVFLLNNERKVEDIIVHKNCCD